MRILSEQEKNRLWKEVREDFPDDETMQQVHYVRLIHRALTEGMSREQQIRFFEEKKQERKAS